MNKGFDTAVLMLFFTREDTFAQVFEAVRNAKPKKLYLFQDGPRENRPDDMEKILRCRKICENIDWECEVHRNYQEQNLGCDNAQFKAIDWVFENEEELILLEDDCLPSKSFFYFCDELLEKYKNDKRVFMICGRNSLNRTHYANDSSYFFAKNDAIWGWAIWKDRWALCDYKHSFLDNPELVKKVINDAPTKYDGKNFIKRCIKHRSMATDTYVSSFESPIRAAAYLNDMLSIVPNTNLIKNVGITGNSVHTNIALNHIPKKQQKIYYMDANEMEFPLRHPVEVIENKEYVKLRLKTMGADTIFGHFTHRFELLIRKLFIRR